MTAPAPKVSVCIPVYNGAAYLRQTIDSVLAQSLADFELVICDDHSGDGSAGIAAACADARIRLLCNAHTLGFGGNWNRCLAEARGHYIKLLPQDDLLHPDCLARQAAVLDGDTSGGLALVFSARTIIGPQGRPLLTLRYRGPARLRGAEAARRTARAGTNPIGEPGAVLFRGSAARAAGPFEGLRPFVIDIDYWLRLLQHGDAAYLAEPLASFRVSPASQSVRMARQQAGEFTAFLSELSRSGPYRISPLDVRIGTLAASLNAIGRMMFYRLTMGAPP